MRWCANSPTRRSMRTCAAPFSTTSTMSSRLRKSRNPFLGAGRAQFRAPDSKHRLKSVLLSVEHEREWALHLLRSKRRAFQFQQRAFAREAVTIVVQRAVARECAMTRDQNRYGVRADRSAGRPRRIGAPNPFRDVTVGARRA